MIPMMQHVFSRGYKAIQTLKQECPPGGTSWCGEGLEQTLSVSLTGIIIVNCMFE